MEEGKTGCVIKQVTTVGNCSLILLQYSGKEGKFFLRSFLI